MNSSSASSSISSEPSVVDPPAGPLATVTASVPVTAPPLPESHTAVTPSSSAVPGSGKAMLIVA